jgi:hypothetical protein
MLKPCSSGRRLPEKFLVFPSQRQRHPSDPSSESPEGAGYGLPGAGGELFGLGRFESLPPSEMIEDL